MLPEAPQPLVIEAAHAWPESRKQNITPLLPVKALRATPPCLRFRLCEPCELCERHPDPFTEPLPRQDQAASHRASGPGYM